MSPRSAGISSNPLESPTRTSSSIHRKWCLSHTPPHTTPHSTLPPTVINGLGRKDAPAHSPFVKDFLLYFFSLFTCDIMYALSPLTKLSRWHFVVGLLSCTSMPCSQNICAHLTRPSVETRSQRMALYASPPEAKLAASPSKSGSSRTTSRVT